jgi:cyclic nucleotide gated channel, plant
MPIHQKQAGPAARKLGVGNWGKNRIFVAGQDLRYKRIIDPTSDFILLWNYVFRVSCFVALFMDPLYFYVPKIQYGTDTSCVGKDRHLAITITVFRSVADLFYVIQIVIKFMTAYINPSSKSGVFGRGELVTDPNEIAKKYLRSDFAVDLVASIPVPQVFLILSDPLLVITG